jgi:hypothetical protein
VSGDMPRENAGVAGRRRIYPSRDSVQHGCGLRVGWSRTCSTISMEILRIYILNEWKEDLSSHGKGQLSMKTL